MEPGSKVLYLGVSDIIISHINDIVRDIGVVYDIIISES